MFQSRALVFFSVFLMLRSSFAFNLPSSGEMAARTAEYAPAVICGMEVDPDDPMHVDFILNRGQEYLDGQALIDEAQKMVNYFYAALAIPESEVWVNLSPYERDRIITDSFGRTMMGRDMLMQDYMLKQFSSALLYPENELGELIWNRLKQICEEFDISFEEANSFNKIWVMPDKPLVMERGNKAFVAVNRLKVMLDDDLNAQNDNSGQFLSGRVAAILREHLLPVVEKEINTGKTFAPARQMYNSMILAMWYKTRFIDVLINRVYTGKKLVKGIGFNDDVTTRQIYEQYCDSFDKGVFDYLKKEKDIDSGKIIKRKYFAGGMLGVEKIEIADSAAGIPDDNVLPDDIAGLARAGVDIYELGPNAASAVKFERSYAVSIQAALDMFADDQLQMIAIAEDPASDKGSAGGQGSIVLIKPDAMTVPGAEAAEKGIKFFKNEGYSVKDMRVWSGKALRRMMQQHYKGSFDSAAAGRDAVLADDAAASGFNERFGILPEQADIIGGIELISQTGMDPFELETMFNNSFARMIKEGRKPKLVSGVYCCKVEINGKDMYVVNGHVPAMIEAFSKPEARTVSFTVVPADENTTSLSKVRSERLGPTQMGSCEDDSTLRGWYFYNRERLGVRKIYEAAPGRINGFHFSATILEALRERVLWGSDLENEPLALMLIDAGFTWQQLRYLLTQLPGNIYGALEDAGLDSDKDVVNFLVKYRDEIKQRARAWSNGLLAVNSEEKVKVLAERIVENTGYSDRLAVLEDVEFYLRLRSADQAVARNFIGFLSEVYPEKADIFLRYITQALLSEGKEPFSWEAPAEVPVSSSITAVGGFIFSPDVFDIQFERYGNGRVRIPMDDELALITIVGARPVVKSISTYTDWIPE